MRIYVVEISPSDNQFVIFIKFDSSYFIYLFWIIYIELFMSSSISTSSWNEMQLIMSAAVWSEWRLEAVMA